MPRIRDFSNKGDHSFQQWLMCLMPNYILLTDCSVVAKARLLNPVLKLHSVIQKAFYSEMRKSGNQQNQEICESGGCFKISVILNILVSVCEFYLCTGIQL